MDLLTQSYDGNSRSWRDGTHYRRTKYRANLMKGKSRVDQTEKQPFFKYHDSRIEKLSENYQKWLRANQIYTKRSREEAGDENRGG
ncbi:hypothetical protein T265_02791 [Opisthorchis viverrini]|uniref:Uncharacterized protein n=1 Tax=Opisthorchis viverrini TaxID=6198 RepID=A0A074ZUP8_OPIVI|nr:hypothetical protein T265_02791 [Opisthorchis viverrini]KER30861.1 hypothetical protein T265_02791 [Opisthorchis viverrini]